MLVKNVRFHINFPAAQLASSSGMVKRWKEEPRDLFGCREG
jgi:hypothetical protein